MWEKFIYRNWVDEKLDIIHPIVNKEKTKEDLYTLKMLTKLQWEWFNYEEILELNDKYFEELGPIVSALDYDWISASEAIEMVENIENIKEIDRLLIKFLLIYYYKIWE
jgi:hypothetical protein